MNADIGEERAKQAALDHLKATKGTKAHVQSVTRQEAAYVVRLMPEGKWGMLLFFMSYKCRVNAQTGVVESCE